LIILTLEVAVAVVAYYQALQPLVARLSLRGMATELLQPPEVLPVGEEGLHSINMVPEPEAL
jgi:hypothetical protein